MIQQSRHHRCEHRGGLCVVCLAPQSAESDSPSRRAIALADQLVRDGKTEQQAVAEAHARHAQPEAAARKAERVKVIVAAGLPVLNGVESRNVLCKNEDSGAVVITQLPTFALPPNVAQGEELVVITKAEHERLVSNIRSNASRSTDE
jgi:hypothetical protein